MKTKILLLLLLLTVLCALSGCEKPEKAELLVSHAGECWNMGFGEAEIPLPETEETLYIAGYHNGRPIDGVHDLQRASAVWMDTGAEGVLLIGVDCVGLARDTVNAIRARLSDFCRETDCASVNVFSTHDHAGVDTLGLWGPVAIDGKNDAFMENLISAAEQAARAAYDSRTEGALYAGSVETDGILEDSREPYVFDEEMHILRFAPEDGGAGIRMLFYGVHAESLRGDNLTVSRDFPGVVSDIVREKTGDAVLWVPGAVGGLIKSKILCEGEFDAFENCTLTGERAAAFALSEYKETPVSASLSLARTEADIPLDNTLFLYYRFLGVLGNPMHGGADSQTGYALTTEISCLKLGNYVLALLPGELFPELTENFSAFVKDEETFLLVGLCNDELGYIIPEEDFYLDETLPFFVEGVDGNGKKHYEETNSTGSRTAALLAEAFGMVCGAVHKGD